jgi:hypothetical protein
MMHADRKKQEAGFSGSLLLSPAYPAAFVSFDAVSPLVLQQRDGGPADELALLVPWCCWSE